MQNIHSWFVTDSSAMMGKAYQAEAGVIAIALHPSSLRDNSGFPQN